MSAPAIRWPQRYRPENCAVHVANTLEMDVAPEAVWECLVHASAWPEWYPNAANVIVHGAPDGHLKVGERFRWKTFGVTIDSEVEEFIPGERIAWSARAFGLDVYHAWLIVPSPDGGSGCTVITEETQHGFLARLAHALRPGQMHKFHQIWLENLHSRAANTA